MMADFSQENVLLLNQFVVERQNIYTAAVRYPIYPSLVLLLIMDQNASLDIITTLDFYLVPPSYPETQEAIMDLFVVIQQYCPSMECEIIQFV